MDKSGTAGEQGLLEKSVPGLSSIVSEAVWFPLNYSELSHKMVALNGWTWNVAQGSKHKLWLKSHIPPLLSKLYRLKATEYPFSLKGRNADLTSTHRVRTLEMGDTVGRYLWETLSAWGLFFSTLRLSQVWSLHLRYITNTVCMRMQMCIHTYTRSHQFRGSFNYQILASQKQCIWSLSLLVKQ